MASARSLSPSSSRVMVGWFQLGRKIVLPTSSRWIVCTGCNWPLDTRCFVYSNSPVIGCCVICVICNGCWLDSAFGGGRIPACGMAIPLPPFLFILGSIPCILALSILMAMSSISNSPLDDWISSKLSSAYIRNVSMNNVRDRDSESWPSIDSSSASPSRDRRCNTDCNCNRFCVVAFFLWKRWIFISRISERFIPEDCLLVESSKSSKSNTEWNSFKVASCSISSPNCSSLFKNK
mmetsp:Transcript_6025/g.9449  ORF Transcript_6025/g.9449 Transcript_6025/m.9449 type:complete len:236 (+) Transcript_6025:175-882(+)